MGEDITGSIGPVDRSSLRQVRELLLEEEPLAESVAFDDPVNTTELVVSFAVGFDAEGRLEITWWESGAYRYHYTEPEGIDVRFDNHPKSGVPDAHFHPPPEAGTAVPSVLRGTTQPQVVTRAVLSQWRKAVVEAEDIDALNER